MAGHAIFANEQDRPKPNDIVLLTGITGFIGGHIAKALLEEGFRVRGTTRCARNRDDMAFLKHLPNYHLLEVVELDMLDPVDKWAPHMKGCSYFIHSASPFTRCASSPEELITPAVQGTKNFLQAIRLAPLRRVVFTSSFAAMVHGHNPLFDPRPFTEDDWNLESSAESTEPMEWYRASKSLAEQEIWKMPSSHRYCAINPPMVIGPWLKGYNRLNESSKIILEKLKGEEEKVPSGGVGWIDVRDVARAHVAALCAVQTTGRFLISSECMSHLRLNQMLKTLCPLSKVNTTKPAVLEPVLMIDTRKAMMELDMTEYIPVEASLMAQIKALIDSGHLTHEELGGDLASRFETLDYSD